uniref:Uncharacterized protein n=1 Tax=Arundo donax TaxID=35708 RepID=A0A0A8Z138_ARUDO
MSPYIDIVSGKCLALLLNLYCI